MITSVIDRTIAAQSGSTKYGPALKALVAQMVADIPFLSIDTETTDTTSTYDVQLALSFDANTKIRVYNSSSTLYCSAIISGTETTADNQSSMLYPSNPCFVKMFLRDDMALVCWTMNSNAQFNTCWFLFGQAANIYDSNKGTIIPEFGVNSTSKVARVVANGGAADLAVVSATLAPAGVWGGTGNLYSAVPQGFRCTDTINPYSGYIGGDSTFYRLFSGASGLDVPVGEYTIGAHTFFFLPTSTTNINLALRLT